MINTTRTVIAIILITLLPGVALLFKNVTHTIKITNNTESTIDNILLKDGNGNIISEIPSIEKNTSETIKLDKSEDAQVIFLGYYYDEDTSYESFQIKDETNKNSYIKVSIDTIYQNGKMELETK